LAALIGNLFNLPTSVAGRTTSLIFYCGAGYLAYNLLRKITSNSIANFSTILFFLTPFSIEYSNAVLIESCAVFFLVLSASYARKYFENQDFLSLQMSSLFLGVAALVKITTVIPSIFPIWVLMITGTSFFIFERKFWIFVGFQCLFFIPSILWIRFSDSIKSKSITTSWLTSSQLSTWNFGTFEERLSPLNWHSILDRYWLLGGVALFIIFPLLLIIGLIKFRTFRHLAIILASISSPLVFFNLYVVHDYYFVALIFPVFLSFGMLLHISVKSFQKWNHGVIPIALAFLLLIPSWTIEIPGRNYKELIQSKRSLIPELSKEISSVTNRSDRILVSGCDWDPTILYYADRYGISTPGWMGSTDDALMFIKQHKFKDSPTFLAICGKNQAPSVMSASKLKKISKNVWKIL
jgi:hypothetical protein